MIGYLCSAIGQVTAINFKYQRENDYLFSKFFNKPVDIELSEVSQLLFLDGENPVPKKEIFFAQEMDYSLKSPETIEKYLNELILENNFDDYYNLVVLRVGAYLGEVIKQNSPHNYHWYDYKTAVKIDKSISQWDSSIETAAILHSKSRNQTIFPIAKVCKYIQNGPEDSLIFYANVLIER